MKQEQNIIKFSVLIPFFRKENALKAVLFSLLRQKKYILEIIILCDGCPVPSLNPDTTIIRYIAQAQNQGLSTARNRLINAAKSEFLLFLDADCVLLKNSLQELNKHWDQKSFFGGQEFSSPRKHLADRFRHYFWRQTQTSSTDQTGHNTHHSISSRPTDFLMGLCCGGLKTNFQALQGFNPRFQNYGEDLEFSFYAVQQGHQITYLPNLKVFHFRRDSLKTLFTLIKNHSKGQINAFLCYQKSVKILFINNLNWIFKSSGSALLRKYDPILALLSLLNTSFALVCKTWYFYRFQEEKYARRS